MSTAAFHLALADLNPSKPTGRDESGRPFYTVRSRIPFAFGLQARSMTVRGADGEPLAPTGRAMTDCKDCGGTGKMDGEDCASCEGTGKVEESRSGELAPETRAAAEENDGMSGGAGPRITGPKIEGIASSSGRDCYGTEMSRKCLDGMAAQFRSGSVVYLPAHPSWSGQGGEWDDVMGYVYDGTVERGDVADATAPEEPSYVLRVGVQLDSKHPKTALAADKIADGYKIGQSIGGWFTELRFVWPEGTDEDDKWWSVEPERIIVEEVELDHLAMTRRPANVESWIDGVRSALRAHGEALAERTRKRGNNIAPLVNHEETGAPVPALRSDSEPAPVADPEPEPSPPAALDNESPTSHAAEQDAPEARHDGTPTMEHSMTPEQIKALIDEAVRSAIASAVPAAVAAVRTAPAEPAKTPEQIEIENLRAQNARLQDDLRGALAQPVRRGLVQFSEPAQAEDAMNVLLSKLDTEGRGRRMASVMRSKGFLARRTTDADKVGPTLVDKGTLEADLRSIILAAEQDGLVKSGDEVAWA